MTYGLLYATAGMSWLRIEPRLELIRSAQLGWADFV